MHQKFISPASFSRALCHLVALGTLSASEAVKYRSGVVPHDFQLLLPHGAVMRHSPGGYVIQGGNPGAFQADLAWALA
ncbi:hypothetical protein EHF33_01460 [Deinococcus psychrotolerans]|uniref:Uncharacterized protein n=2 Tax=Deinococcus TaxID=1298 RepID=A0A553V2Y4_9DEIO|nr:MULTISPECIES: hypothetical protein [Deinococcus]AZI41586.1 hypothetical protein EHF33_01460 [Deinococcus psychrotolerans]TSA86744.1 hypothetical protein FNU79_06005 [Deinococcus detaillensis]